MRRSDEMESMVVGVVLMAAVGGRRFFCVKFDKIASFLLFCCFSRCSSLLIKLTKRTYFHPRKSCCPKSKKVKKDGEDDEVKMTANGKEN